MTQALLPEPGRAGWGLSSSRSLFASNYYRSSTVMDCDPKIRKAPPISPLARQELETWLAWHEARARQICGDLQGVPKARREPWLENLIRHWRGGYRVIRWLRAQNRRGLHNGEQSARTGSETLIRLLRSGRNKRSLESSGASGDRDSIL